LNVSRTAAVVFLGFDIPRQGDHIQFFQDVEVLTEGLPDTVLVCSVQGVDLEA